MTDYIECAGCRKQVARTKATPEKYRKHKPFKGATPDDGFCDYGGTVIPPEVLECLNVSNSNAGSPTASSATSSPDDAPTDAASATSTPPSSSDPAPSDASTSATAEPALPGAEEYSEKLNDLAATQLAKYKAEFEANFGKFSQPSSNTLGCGWCKSNDPTPHPECGSHAACPCMTVHGKINCQGTCQPEQPTLFSQPAGRTSEEPAAEMDDLGKELTARLKEMFYAYDNRRSSDNRSAQATMGPSEMGTPCDRRLALSLMRMPPVNPGGDGWAAFVGTCIHAGLEAMFVWADAGTGRFAVEQRLEFPSAIVPKGTADLIDRTLFMLDDHKCQGRWSRNKLKSRGPSPTYRVQAHTYAYGARLRGERIERVAIISWPRDESTLDDLYVWTEPYRPDIVTEAFARVDSIAAEVNPHLGGTVEEKARASSFFNVADDCRFCPFYLPNARDITKGCNGKR